jgi:hypothetical protein
MTNIHGMGYLDTTGAYHGWIDNSGAPQICSQDYLQAIAEGDIANHTPWSKIGYTPTMTTTESTIWSAAGAYVFPTAAAGMEFLSSNNIDDIGTVLHSGVTTTGGSTTTLQKVGENFLTTTVAGDCVIVDAAGATPEWGYITSVDSNTQITFAGGLSSGGSGAARATYSIIDKSATLGAHAVKIEYLDGAFAQKSEIGILNGTTVIPTVNLDLYRINSWRIIAAGGNNRPTGNLTLRNLADTPVYGYISAQFTRARGGFYTVPAGKTLYITNGSFGFSLAAGTKWEYARLYLRANREPATGFFTGTLFYNYGEILANNSSVPFEWHTPQKFTAGTDIRIDGIASAAGVAVSVVRGWLE